MNRMFLPAIMAVVVGVAPVGAQSKKADATATGTTRVAVINLGLVFNKYERAAALKKEMESTLAPLKEEAKRLTENMTGWQASMSKLEPGDPQRKQYEDKIFQGRRQMEDMQRTASFRLGKVNEDNLIVIWKDIHQAVKEYSTKHNIELVMAYGDPTDKNLTATLPNINRKMQVADAGGSVPFFITPRADISEAVVAQLNKQYRANQARTTKADDLE